ncbi:hypothetical protein QFZ23_004020 [Arthrobacter globiformis]|uniref:hypothetical protein n=1 Tax=Arthrobacter globiformis TaxID=1665 RepID=UPI0027882A08|nr:hypothetical protein [Arthrobacter globiformis]MDQ1060119.1 hypothetical protein [Arthrobacter globiformis]
MPTVRIASAHRFLGRAQRTFWLRAPAPAVVLFFVLVAAVLGGCEYSYDDGRGELPAAAPVVTDPVLPRDPLENVPVAGQQLTEWAEEVLPDAEGQVFHTSYGSVARGQSKTESTKQLPGGTYSLTLACRSERRVSFTVRDAEFALVDLSLRCGTSRVNVVHLSEDSVLRVTVEARSDANFAYRISRI